MYILMIIAEFFLKNKKNIIEELEEDAKEDMTLLKEILDLHSKKLIKVKGLIDIWEIGKNIKKIDSIVAEIEKSNKELLAFINKMLKIETKEDSIVRLLLAKNSEKIGVEAQQNIEKLLENLEEHLKYFHDILINLRFLIEKQSNYIKKYRSLIVKDIEEHLAFYYMLKHETAIEERLNKFASMIENEAKYLLNLTESKPEGAISFEEVFSPDGQDLIKLYNEIFLKAFPDTGELLAMGELEKELKQRYRKIQVREANYHILIIKVGPTPAGAAMFDVCPINKTVCVGVTYYFFLEKVLLEDVEEGNKVSRMLLEAMIRILYNDAKRFGYADLSALIAEVDNPERKTEFKFKRRKDKTGIKSYKRSLELNASLMRMNDLRKADFSYIVSDLQDPNKNVTYLDFYVKPLRDKWVSEKKLHSSEFLPILRVVVQQGYELLSERPELYNEMEKEIVQKKFIGLL